MTGTVDPVEQLLAIEEIKQLKHRYLRHMDAKEWDHFADLLLPDVEFFFGVPDEQFWPDTVERTPEGWVQVARDELVAWASAGAAGSTTVHHAHMPDITIDGPDRAHATWSLTDVTRFDADPSGRWYRGYGGYEEEYRRTPDGWRISRSVFFRWSIDPFDTGDPGKPPAG
jgi:hypothetical protein